jgi:hypothetical protein
MVVHQCTGVEGALLLVQRCGQPVQVSVIVFFAKEAGFAVVSPLFDLQGHSIKVNTGTVQHEQTITEYPRLAPLILVIYYMRKLRSVAPESKGLDA